MAYPYYQPYQNPYYPPMPEATQMRQPVMQQAQPMQQGGVQWVSGELEARNYLIAPNSAVALWDSTGPRVYLKKADASGKPTLQIFDLVERAETPAEAPQVPAVSYANLTNWRRLCANCVARKRRNAD